MGYLGMVRYINIDKERNQAHLRWSDEELKTWIRTIFSREIFQQKWKKAMCIETHIH